MWFVDRAQITVKAGDGGRGCTAFAQPPYTRYPYPDGGDGGNGGDVIVSADPNIATLLDFHFRHEFKAGRGGHGSGNKKLGKHGADLTIRVPVGTIIHDADAAMVLRDLSTPGERVVVAKGGVGGFGNAMKKLNQAGVRRRSSAGSERSQQRLRTRRAFQEEATPGKPGEQRRLSLELKLIADVGIIGFPNAGKSSFLARISTAHPKIAAYPFTTRYPVLGVIDGGEKGSFVACDIPGLIEGAHEGRGLGMQFLRHIERTKVLVHLIDTAAVDGRDPVEAFKLLNHELSAYGREVLGKPQIVAANKMDLPHAAEHLRQLERALGHRAGKLWPISCATGMGVSELVNEILRVLRTHATATAASAG